MPNEKYHKIYGQNQDQGEKWNSKMGLAWVKNDEKMNSLLEVMTGKLLKDLGQLDGKEILDIGCGSGEISKLLLAKVGSNGNVQGVDISKPLLELAFKKYGHMRNIKFLNADAQSFRFKLSFYDQIISRFGVMFFENPVVAFRNMHRSLKSNGRLDFICWSALEDNEFFFFATTNCSKVFK
jgi:ubiquinone/menaquinone biosynthesis C-methylase UbiE